MLCFLSKSTVRKDKMGSLGHSCSCMTRHSGLNRECGLVGMSAPMLSRSTCARSWGLEKAICEWGARKDDTNPSQMCSARVRAPWSHQTSLTKYKFKDNRNQASRWQPKSRRASRGPSEPASAAQLAEGAGLAGLGAGGGPRAREVVAMPCQRRHHSPRGTARPPRERGRQGP